MKEYKWSVGQRHKVTKEKLNRTVWAPIGPECDYEWTGTGPVYENNQRVEREEA